MQTADLVMTNVDKYLSVMSIITTSFGCVLPTKDYLEKVCRRYRSNFRNDGYEVHPNTRGQGMEEIVRQEVMEVVHTSGTKSTTDV